MRIYARADGIVIRLLTTPEEEANYPNAPEGTAETLEVDAETNPRLLEINKGADGGVNALRLQAGVVYLNGQPLAVNAAGTAYGERRQALALAQGLRDYVALSAPTQAQTVMAVKALCRLVLVLGREVLRLKGV